MSEFFISLLGVLMFITAVLLILLVLIQRGKGGGLAGAFGGMGGQSAFGTKAGDLFTRITIGVAAVWIILCMIAVGVLSNVKSSKFEGMGGAAPKPGAAAPASTENQTGGGESTDSGNSASNTSGQDDTAGE